MNLGYCFVPVRSWSSRDPAVSPRSTRADWVRKCAHFFSRLANPVKFPGSSPPCGGLPSLSIVPEPRSIPSDIRVGGLSCELMWLYGVNLLVDGFSVSLRALDNQGTEWYPAHLSRHILLPPLSHIKIIHLSNSYFAGTWLCRLYKRNFMILDQSNLASLI